MTHFHKSDFHKPNTEPYYPVSLDHLKQPSTPENPNFPWWVPGNQWVSIAWFGGVHVITRRRKP